MYELQYPAEQEAAPDRPLTRRALHRHHRESAASATTGVSASSAPSVSTPTSIDAHRPTTTPTLPAGARPAQVLSREHSYVPNGCPMRAPRRRVCLPPLPRALSAPPAQRQPPPQRTLRRLSRRHTVQQAHSRQALPLSFFCTDWHLPDALQH